MTKAPHFSQRRYQQIACALLCLAVVTAKASTAPSVNLDLKQTKNSVLFLGVGNPGFLKIRGELDTDVNEKPLEGMLKIDGETLAGSASFDLRALKTGIKLRDKHMKNKYLKVSEFPKAKLILAPTALGKPIAQLAQYSKKAIPFKGSLEVHGKTAPVEGTLDVSKKDGELQLSFVFGTTISGHGIALPSFMGVTVAEDVSVEVDILGKL